MYFVLEECDEKNIYYSHQYISYCWFPNIAVHQALDRCLSVALTL